MSLSPGMELAENVYSHKNELIMSRDTVLNQDLIAKLSRYSIMCVSVKDASDFAHTHFAWIRTTPSFKAFEAVYQECMKEYTQIMNDFLTNHTPLDMNLLNEIYKRITSNAKTGEQLLDYLYNLLPVENEFTHAHCLNSALICGVFANWLCLPDEDANLLVQCGFCYDIGKLKLPDSLLWKPGKFSAFEFNWIKTHTAIGYDMLKDQNLNTHILNAALMHHERYDGSGYPNGLKGEEIDRFALYLAIVDSYEAMTSARPYRPTMIPFQVIDNFLKTGYEKYCAGILLPFLERIANTQLGITVRLSDESIADVILINRNALTRPLLKCNETLLDLTQYPELEITAIL